MFFGDISCPGNCIILQSNPDFTICPILSEQDRWHQPCVPERDGNRRWRGASRRSPGRQYHPGVVWKTRAWYEDEEAHSGAKRNEDTRKRTWCASKIASTSIEQWKFRINNTLKIGLEMPADSYTTCKSLSRPGERTVLCRYFPEN